VLHARLGLEPVAHLEPVHSRHHRVEENHVGALTDADMQRLRSAPRRAYLEILCREPGFEQLYIGVNIVDDENTGGMAFYRASPMNCLTVSRNIETEIGLEM
jgi:tRNA(Ile)-lysidine synthase TilS/MesJ